MMKLEIINWRQAEQIYLEASRLATPAFCHILRFYANLEPDMEYILDVLETSEKEETTVNDIPRLPDDIQSNIIRLMHILVAMIILYPDDDWAKLINAILSIVDTYVGVLKTVATALANNDELEMIVQLQLLINRTGKTLELGNVMENLVPTLALVLSELKHTRASQPISFQLSKAYLDALHFDGQDITV